MNRSELPPASLNLHEGRSFAKDLADIFGKSSARSEALRAQAVATSAALLGSFDVASSEATHERRVISLEGHMACLERRSAADLEERSFSANIASHVCARLLAIRITSLHREELRTFRTARTTDAEPRSRPRTRTRGCYRATRTRARPPPMGSAANA
jgi:hypothetical protein